MVVNAILAYHLIPDVLLRSIIKRRIFHRLKTDLDLPSDYDTLLHRKLANSAITIDTTLANEQHYELPPKFFETILGPYLKYSSLFYENYHKHITLPAAEEKMLTLTIERAGFHDGMNVLDLGCGWGSMSFALAKRFPNMMITAFSNSSAQGKYIMEKAQTLGITTITHVKGDIGTYEFNQKFDAIISVEMFEHVRNHTKLFAKLSVTLQPGGFMYIHLFARRGPTYLFDKEKSSDWMAQYFFSGGIMVNDYYLEEQVTDDLTVEKSWRVDGKHYAMTLRAWLDKMDKHKNQLKPLFKETYGSKHRLWWHRWRIFFMATEELFGYDYGTEWFVKHYRIVKETTA